MRAKFILESIDDIFKPKKLKGKLLKRYEFISNISMEEIQNLYKKILKNNDIISQYAISNIKCYCEDTLVETTINYKKYFLHVKIIKKSKNKMMYLYYKFYDMNSYKNFLKLIYAERNEPVSDKLIELSDETFYV